MRNPIAAVLLSLVALPARAETYRPLPRIPAEKVESRAAASASAARVSSTGVDVTGVVPVEPVAPAPARAEAPEVVPAIDAAADPSPAASPAANPSPAVSRAADPIPAVSVVEVGMEREGVLSVVQDISGQRVERRLEQDGTIVERILDPAGAVVLERTVAHAAALPLVGELRESTGRRMRVVRDPTGALIYFVQDSRGRVTAAQVMERAEKM